MGNNVIDDIDSNEIERVPFSPITVLRYTILYLRRQRENYHYGLFAKGPLFFIHDWFTKSLNSNNCFCCSLLIDGNVAAAALGYYDKVNKRVEIPRLAIDASYERYSPGMLMCCGTIEYLIGDSNIDYFDLARGDEIYKQRLGGEKYNSYNVQISF